MNQRTQGFGEKEGLCFTVGRVKGDCKISKSKLPSGFGSILYDGYKKSTKMLFISLWACEGSPRSLDVVTEFGFTRLYVILKVVAHSPILLTMVQGAQSP